MVSMRPLLPRLAAITVLTASLPAVATAAEQPPDEQFEEIVVSGEQPGPAMWKVSRDGHTMWVLGTLGPLPAKMTWRSKQVEEVISRSGEVLGGYDVDARIKGGKFAAMRFLPALMRLRYNADKKTLREVLPAATYERWSAMHKRFFGHDPDPKERARPAYAAGLLYDRALEKSGLSEREIVQPVLDDLAKRHKVRVREKQLLIPIDNPKELIKEFSQPATPKEIACLEATLDSIEKDLPNMRRRAQAWAVGDIATLRALPVVEREEGCFQALLEGPKLKKLIDEQIATMRRDRPNIIAYMLAAHETSFTAQPIDQILREGGMLDQMRAAGYTVEEPQ